MSLFITIFQHLFCYPRLVQNVLILSYF